MTRYQAVSRADLLCRALICGIEAGWCSEEEGEEGGMSAQQDKIRSRLVFCRRCDAGEGETRDLNVVERSANWVLS